MNHIEKYVKINIFMVLSCFLKILEFNQYRKTDKTRSLIHAHLEYLVEKIDGCKNNSENSSTTKLGEDISFSYSV